MIKSSAEEVRRKRKSKKYDRQNAVMFLVVTVALTVSIISIALSVTTLVKTNGLDDSSTNSDELASSATMSPARMAQYRLKINNKNRPKLASIKHNTKHPSHKKTSNISRILQQGEAKSGTTFFLSREKVGHPLGYELMVHVQWSENHLDKMDYFQKKAKRYFDTAILGPCTPGYYDGLKMKSAFNWMFDESSVDSGSLSFIYNCLQTARDGWQQYTTEHIFGNQITWDGTGADLGQSNGKNEIDFGTIDESGVLAYTYIYGYFDSYPVSQREITEYDMRFNSAVNWGDATQNPNAYDLQKVSTHEHGHTLYLADVYDNSDRSCRSAVVMSGTSSRGQSFPREPQPQDIYAEIQLYTPSNLISNIEVNGEGSKLNDGDIYFKIALLTGLVLLLLDIA